MASDAPPASSAQKPFAHPQPQPAPVQPTGAQTASPPTKQSLKSWWKTFRPPPKKEEPQGNNPRLIRSVIFCRASTSGPPLRTTNATRFVSRIPRNISTRFQESQIDSKVPAVAGDPFEDGLPGSGSNVSYQQFSFHHSTSSTPLLPTRGARAKSRGYFAKRVAKQYSRIKRRVILIRPKGNKICVQLAKFLGWIETYLQISKSFEQPTGIFGVPLRQSITYANVAISLVDGEGKSYIYGYVPIVVAKCGVYLKEKATNVEGIFRLSGSEKRIKELKTIFDSPDRYGKGLDWDGYTVHDAANVLRRYLNQLPEPIVPLDLYDRFRAPLRGHTMQAVGDAEGGLQFPDNFDIRQAISTYQELITELPPLNRQLLLYILDLLAVFASKSDENRMNAVNLSAIFQPGMLSHPAHDMAPSEYRLSQDVLIFLIENQDHFLIGMRGTAADEETVQQVQGGTPPPGTPSTPGRSKTTVGRSASNASAGADSVRKFGGIRRNVSVSSRHSRQSNGAPSPASPAYGPTLTTTSSGGVHRSNTVPSKKSPGLPSNRVQKNSETPSPTTTNNSSHLAAPRGISPADSGSPARRGASPSPVVAPTALGTSSLAPSNAATAPTSQERLLVDTSQKQGALTPTREKNITSFFQRSPTVENDKKQPNKLRKKRIPSSSNPSAQSSTNSLTAQAEPTSSHPALPSQDVTELPHLEALSPLANPALSNTSATPPLTQTPLAEQSSHHLHSNPLESHQSSDKTLKPIASPTSSLHSHSSFNDQSDLDHVDDPSVTAEQTEKRSRWRVSRRKDDSHTLAATLNPKKGTASDNGAGASSSSVGSSRPQKSLAGDTIPSSTDTTLVNAHPQVSNESGLTPVGEEKKGPLGWIKNKMREKREEKEAEKERNKSPPATGDRASNLSSSALPTRGKSVEIKREEILSEQKEQKIEEQSTATSPQS
ncbi:hypothetical protein B7494_g7046 [Chlorociboria aeruginascens]|nr:hypothetical protein B7494_g7046 [Chlorociboria aeruginascens]